MKRWLGRALTGLGVCLLLGLGHVETGRGVGSHPCIASWGRSVGGCAEPAPASPTATPTAQKAAPPGQAHAPSELGALQPLWLSECGVGPLGLESRGPPGKVSGAWVDSWAADQLGSPRPGGRCASGCLQSGRGPHAQEGGFATAFS